MKRKFIIIISLLVFVLLIIFIFNAKQEEANSQLANPAAIYCEEQGHNYEIRTAEDGEYGICVFPDNLECGAWDYFCGCTHSKIYCGKEYQECSYKCEQK